MTGSATSGGWWRARPYSQLGHNPLLLLGTLAGMAVIYLAPPVALFAGSGWAMASGGLACVAMVLAYCPTLRLYGLPPVYALSLPIAGLLYTLMTLDSARRHYVGRQDQWKGRRYAPQTG